MSGLASYFRLADDDNHREQQERSGSHEESSSHFPGTEYYAKSLEELESTALPTHTQDNDNHNDASSLDCQVPWREWRARNKHRVVDYLSRRLGAATTEVLTAKNLTSQTDDCMGTEKDGTPLQRHCNESGFVVPQEVVHVQNARHEVHYLSDLDLTTKRLVSCLCSIENVRPERSTKRPGLCRTTRRSATHDGPLSFIYKRVVSFEAVQVMSGERDELRQRALNCIQTGTKTKNRIKVFLYNNYAGGFSKILQVQPSKNHTINFQMESIPAMCVFPYQISDWSEDDMVPFCICVGDNSVVKFDDGALKFDKGVRLRFQFKSDVAPPTSGKIYTLEASEDKVSLEEGDAEPLGGSVPLTRLLEQNHSTTEPLVNQSTSFSTQSTAQVAVPMPMQNGTTIDGPGSVQSLTTKPTVMYYKLGQMRDVLKRQKDLRSSEFVCLFAVVLGFSARRLTKRGEWMLTASLIDDTVSLRSGSDDDHVEVESISINIFSRSKERLPDLRYCGDVIRLHRAKVNEFQDEVQLLGQAPTSYVTFRGNADDPSRNDCWTAAAVARDYEVSEEELPTFARFWRWGQQRLRSFPTMKPEHSTMIGDMLGVEATELVEGHRDFTLMVGAILPIPADPSTAGVTPRGLLRAWDGTGVPRSDPIPELVPPDLAQTALVDGDPPGRCLDKLATLIDRLRSLQQSDMRAPESLSGRVVNVVVWEDAHWEKVQQVLQVGMFVRLRNVRESILYGTSIRCLNVSAMSYLNPLPDLTCEVIQLLEAHNARLLRGEDYNPASGVSSFRPDELPKHIRMDPERAAPPSRAASLSRSPAGEESSEAPPFAARDGLSPASKRIKPTFPCQTLLELLEGPVGSEFGGSVRLTGTVPPVDLGDSRTVRQLLAHNASRRLPSKAGVCRWRFAVALEDGTAALTAIVTDAVGEALLGWNATDAQRRLSEVLVRLGGLIRSHRPLQVRVRSVELQGAKYFLVDWIQQPVP